LVVAAQLSVDSNQRSEEADFNTPDVRAQHTAAQE
jgi:hypothetical protein